MITEAIPKQYKLILDAKEMKFVKQGLKQLLETFSGLEPDTEAKLADMIQAIERTITQP